MKNLIKLFFKINFWVDFGLLCLMGLLGLINLIWGIVDICNGFFGHMGDFIGNLVYAAFCAAGLIMIKQYAEPGFDAATSKETAKKPAIIAIVAGAINGIGLATAAGIMMLVAKEEFYGAAKEETVAEAEPVEAEAVEAEEVK